VLNSITDQIRDCLQRAEDCALQAAAQTDPGLRHDFLQLAKRWRELAQSIESESLTTFPNDSPKPNGQPSPQ
jgi:hypothetical protein